MYWVQYGYKARQWILSIVLCTLMCLCIVSQPTYLDVSEFWITLYSFLAVYIISLSTGHVTWGSTYALSHLHSLSLLYRKCLLLCKVFRMGSLRECLKEKERLIHTSQHFIKRKRDKNM
ncbi:hypothetical protein XENTR_v10024421 [Xenopus tropicalis]|nr:hypothetical protein XENTR_v10024421 [Xenopus tropicalis]